MCGFPRRCQIGSVNEPGPEPSSATRWCVPWLGRFAQGVRSSSALGLVTETGSESGVMADFMKCKKCREKYLDLSGLGYSACPRCGTMNTAERSKARLTPTRE